MKKGQDSISTSGGFWHRLWTTRKGNLIVSGTVACLAALVFVLFHTGKISITGILPPCLFRAVTGFRCMGCGATRSIQCFLQGNWGESFFYNPMFFLIGLLTLIFYGIFTVNALRPQYRPLHIGLKRYQIVLLAVLAVAFLIVRNTPWYRTNLY